MLDWTAGGEVQHPAAEVLARLTENPQDGQWPSAPRTWRRTDALAVLRGTGDPACQKPPSGSPERSDRWRELSLPGRTGQSRVGLTRVPRARPGYVSSADRAADEASSRHARRPEPPARPLELPKRLPPAPLLEVDAPKVHERELARLVAFACLAFPSQGMASSSFPAASGRPRCRCRGCRNAGSISIARRHSRPWPPPIGPGSSGTSPGRCGPPPWGEPRRSAGSARWPGRASIW